MHLTKAHLDSLFDGGFIGRDAYFAALNEYIEGEKMNELEATRAKLKCLEIVEGTNLNWWSVVKVRVRSGDRIDIFIPLFPFDFTYNEIATYEFALGVVEGKPVWEGDKLYWTDGSCATAKSTTNFNTDKWSWNPPKPATLMVELPIELAQEIIRRRSQTMTRDNLLLNSVAASCITSLEQLK